MARPIVIAGGGTGGHVFPMAAIAEALQATGEAAGALVFVGSRRGQEDRLAPSGVALVRLPGRGVRRSMAPTDLMSNVAAVLGLVAACFAAVALFARWRPRAVVSVGGYASLAADVAAVALRRPLVLVDFDATPGATHRLVARFAAARCTAFPQPGATVTGAPLRQSILAVDRAPVSTRRASEPGTRWRIVVMTGSLGARSVNRAVIELAERWRDRGDVQIHHVTGTRDAALCATAWHPRPTDALAYRQEPFVDMAGAWATCDLAVCRAGALTVAELTALGVPSVLVPLPGAPGDHQRFNAEAVAAAGGAVVVADNQLSGATLAAAIEPLLSATALTEMESGAKSLGRRDGAAAIARVVAAVARG